MLYYGSTVWDFYLVLDCCSWNVELPLETTVQGIWHFGSMLIAPIVTLEAQHRGIVAFKVHRGTYSRNRTATNSKTWNSHHIDIIWTRFFPEGGKTGGAYRGHVGDAIKATFLIPRLMILKWVCCTHLWLRQKTHNHANPQSHGRYTKESCYIL